MEYRYRYKTPEGFSDLWLSGDGDCLTGLWFEGSRDSGKHPANGKQEMLPVFEDTLRWLDVYFSGRQPDFTPKWKIDEATPFRREVVSLMLEIPFGQTVTYGELAKKLAAGHGVSRMSAQAVGGAVGWNPICLIIPCHRVLGAGGALTGYGGGIGNKLALLRLEGSCPAAASGDFRPASCNRR